MNLETYIFLDDDNNFIEEMGLHDDDVADDYCKALTKIQRTNISCYHLVSAYDYEKEQE
jgi:hypothetical protein